VNESKPGAIPFHYSYALTGKVDEYLEQLGFKAADYSLQITRDFLASNKLR
jgi:N-acetylglutamate synthase-like GNAT family acetyltransferase